MHKEIPLSNATRPLTALEKVHARTVYLRVVFFRWLLVLFGILFLILSVGLPVAFVADDIRVPLPLIVFMGLVDLLIVALGALFIAHGLGRATTLGHTATQLRGRLIEKKRTASAGNGGGRFTVYTYFIDDVQLYWPPGAERIYKPLIDQTITLTVAMIDVRSRAKLKALLKCIGIGSRNEEISGMGVVLKCQQAIDVHGVLEKYGRYYLVRHQLQWAAGFGFFTVLAFLLFMHPATNGWMVQKSYFMQAVIVFGYIFGSMLTAALVANGYPALRKRLNSDYDDTPHEERLKG